jgi:hypothetical protein
MQLAIGVALVAALVPSLLAQSAGTGAVTGTVTDPSGAVIAGAMVTATHIDTNQERTTTTGADGSYRFTLLPPGNYRVRISAAGFKTAEVSSFAVAVTETAALNRQLEVGAPTEQITVESVVETIQTAHSTLGTTVTGSNITNMPLFARNYTQILATLPGVQVSAFNGASFGKGTENMSVNGARPDQNNFQMDGVSVVNAAGFGMISDFGIYTGIGIPSPDAIQEFKMQTSTYDASYGRNPGGNLNLVTRSGANDFHASLFEYFRNEKLNANSFFQNRDGGGVKQVLKQNQFGGTIGGPIIQDKLFFFGSYQATRQRNGVAVQGTTNAFLYPIPAGDRNAPGFRAALGAAICPQNHPGDARYLTFGALIGFPAMNVACDGSNISPVALNLLNVKTASGEYYIPGSGASSIVQRQFTLPAKYTEDQYIVNGDWTATDKHTLTMRYFFTKNPQETVLGGQLPGRINRETFSNTNSMVRLTSLISPTFINQLRASMQRNVSEGRDQLPYTPQQIGLKPMIPTQTLPPLMIIGGMATIGGNLAPWFSPPTQVQIADQFSWSKGSHTMRAGYEYENVQWNLVFAGLGRGFLLINSFADLLIGRAGCLDPTCSPGNPGNTTGVPFGSILACLFCVRGGPDGIIHGYRLRNQNAFFQDDWKVNSRLTINWGVRWEKNGTLADVYGNLTNLWPSDLRTIPTPPTSPGTSSAAFVGYVVPNNHPQFYGNPPAGVRVHPEKFPSLNGIPNNNFGPRFGFAWQPTGNGKLVIRGGFGMFYDRIGTDKFVHAVQEGKPYADTISYSGPNPFSLATPFLERPLAFAPRWFNPVTLQGSSFNSPFYETIHTPMSRQYNLSLQYEFLPRWVLETGFVGASGINQVNYNHNHNTAMLASPSRPVNGFTTNTTQNAVGRAPYLGFQPAGLQGTDYDAIYNYNSLQVLVRKQMSRGFTMQASYTWSKSLANLQGSSANSNHAGDLGQQYGRTGFVRPHRFVVSYSYDLPFNASGAMGKVVQGWAVTGGTIVQNGTPLTFIDTAGGSAFGTAGGFSPDQGQSRAHLCPGITHSQILTSGEVKLRLGGASGGSGYINQAAFCPTPVIGDPEPPFGARAATDYGNSGVGIAQGPGQFNWDIAITKLTSIRERHKVQFRAEFFNAFNHAQFGNPGVARSTPATFGVINALSTTPRIIQFALRYSF